MKKSSKIAILVLVVLMVISVGFFGVMFFMVMNQNGEYNYHFEEGDSVKMVDDRMQPASSGNRFVVVSYEVFNSGSTQLYFTDSTFDLKDSAGNIYKAWGDNDDFVNHTPSVSLGKHERACECVIYEVPVGVALSDLEPSYHNFGKMVFANELVIDKYFKANGTIVTP
ncbi:MAG: DUF4352 domain-containing protein [archaeon]|nr:DUF4352 domain-containing protein [archaeon]